MLRDRRCAWVLLAVAALGGCRGVERTEAQARALSEGFTIGPVQALGAAANDAPYKEQSSPSVAHGGGIFLAVWVAEDRKRLYAVRIRASDGQVLDDRRRLGILVGDVKPLVQWDGENFLVVWSSAASLYRIRIGTDGKLVDPSPVVFHSSKGLSGLGAMAHGTSEDLMVWQDGTTVVAARFSHEGRMLGSVIPLGNAGAERPAAAFDGANYLVVWGERQTGFPVLFGNRVRASDGALLDGDAGFQLSTSTLRLFDSPAPAVAFDGTNYLVVYRSSTVALVGSRVRASDGARPDATSLALASRPEFDANEPEFAELTAPRLIFDGTHFVMLWRDHPPIREHAGDSTRIARIDPASGANLDGKGVDLGGASAHDVAAGAGRTFAVLGRGSPWGSFVNPTTGAVDGTPVLLSRSSHWQEATDSAADGQRHLVVWHEWNGARFEVRGARVSNQDGTILDPKGITISSSADGDQLYPSVAASRTNYLVVWWDGRGLRANRVNGSDGSVLDGAGIELSAKPDSPVYTWDKLRYQAASDGSDYLVFWVEANRSKTLRIRGSDGVALDSAPRDIGAPSQDRRYARVTFSGSRYVTLWQDGTRAPNGSTTYEVKAVRLGTDGSVIDQMPLVIGTGDFSLREPRMASDGENLLVTWYAGSGVRGRRLRLSDGAILDSADLVLDPGVTIGQGPLVYDGQSFVALWPVSFIYTGVYQAAVARIGRTGTLLDRPPITIASLDYSWKPLALSAGAGGKVLATYVTYDDTADFQTERLRTRLLNVPSGPGDAGPDGAPDAGVPALDASATLEVPGPADEGPGGSVEPSPDLGAGDTADLAGDAAPQLVDGAGSCACHLGGRPRPPALAGLAVLLALGAAGARSSPGTSSPARSLSARRRCGRPRRATRAAPHR